MRDAARWDAERLSYSVQRGVTEAKLAHPLDEALARAVLFDDRAGAASRVDRALAATPLEKLPASTRPYRELAFVYGMAGRAADVRQLLASFEKSRGQVVAYTDAVDRPLLRGLAAYADRQYDEAIRQFQVADQGDCLGCAPILLAHAYDAAGKPDSAIALYEKYIQLPDAFRLLGDQHFLAPAHRRAGELYEAKGDVANAAKHYREFIELWKNADPELQPKVAEVRRKVARLADVERR